MTIQGDLFMGKTNLKIEYVLKAANNIGFDFEEERETKFVGWVGSE